MRRERRKIYYVCSSIIEDNLVSSLEEANTENDAAKEFNKKYGVFPKIILGAFYLKQQNNLKLKKTKEVKTKKQIHSKISSKISICDTNHGTYDGWNITYLPIKNESNKVYIFYNSRINNDNVMKPKNNIIDISEIIPK